MRNLTIRGANPNPGKWDVTYEHNHAIQVGGAVRLDFDHIAVQNVGGDALGGYLSGGANRCADSIQLHNSSFDGIGRMGVTITDGATNVVVDFNSFRRIGYYTWDIEPNGATVGGQPRRRRARPVLGQQHRDEALRRLPDRPDPGDGYVFVVTDASGGGPAVDIERLPEHHARHDDGCVQDRRVRQLDPPELPHQSTTRRRPARPGP